MLLMILSLILCSVALKMKNGSFKGQVKIIYHVKTPRKVYLFKVYLIF
uniref:Uncharacterized protein n=1 Tax=Anguilla anguilla TaxID=7936 RepID=A0A0E9VKF9_ANGAN